MPNNPLVRASMALLCQAMPETHIRQQIVGILQNTNDRMHGLVRILVESVLAHHAYFHHPNNETLTIATYTYWRIKTIIDDSQSLRRTPIFRAYDALSAWREAADISCHTPLNFMTIKHIIAFYRWEKSRNPKAPKSEIFQALLYATCSVKDSQQGLQDFILHTGKLWDNNHITPQLMGSVSSKKQMARNACAKAKHVLNELAINKPNVPHLRELIHFVEQTEQALKPKPRRHQALQEIQQLALKF